MLGLLWPEVLRQTSAFFFSRDVVVTVDELGVVMRSVKQGIKNVRRSLTLPPPLYCFGGLCLVVTEKLHPINLFNFKEQLLLIVARIDIYSLKN